MNNTKRNIILVILGTVLVVGVGAAILVSLPLQEKHPQYIGPPIKEEILRSTPEITVTVNGAISYQTIEGFGTSVRLFNDPHLIGKKETDPITEGMTMSIGQQNEVLDLLYKDLGLTRVRPITGDLPIEPINDNSDPQSTDLSKFDFSWKRNDDYIAYVKQAVRRGVNTYFLSPVWLEKWMNEGNPEEYVEWAMAIIRRWRNQGMQLPYYSIMNEPGYIRGGIWSPEYIRDVIKLLGPKLKTERFTTKIIVPDDLNPKESLKRASVILADSQARQYVAALATHLYGGTSVSSLKNLADQYSLPLWMTEYYAQDTNAFTWVAIIHDLLVSGVSAIDHMWGFSGSAANGRATLVTLNNNDTRYIGVTREKAYYVMGQFSRYIKPGAKRIQADFQGYSQSNANRHQSSNRHEPNTNRHQTTTSLKMSAYVHSQSNQLTIVALNNGSVANTVQFNLAGFSHFSWIQPIRTSQAENWALLTTIPVTKSSFIATLAPNSITTFTSSNVQVVKQPSPVSGKITESKQSASDSFERSTLGSSWTIYGGGTNVGIVNGSDLGVLTPITGTIKLGLLAWGKDAFSADQFSELTISKDIDPNARYQAFVRRQSTGQRYGFFWQDNKNTNCTIYKSPNGFCEEFVLKLDGGTPGIELIRLSAPKPIPGDTLRIEVQGNLLKGFHNGVQVVSVSENTLVKPGEPGIAMNVGAINVGTVSFPAAVIESWSGGDL